MDSATGETMLQVGCDEHGVIFLSFRLYDASGRVAAESDGFERFPKGLTIKCKAGEQLLRLPEDATAAIQYRLYGPGGGLLTWSDGRRTKICGPLRMDGVSRGWTLPTD